MRQMSGTSALPAPIQAAAAPKATWRLSPYALPLHTLRIAASCALPLIIWFSAGRLVRWALLLLAATLSHGSWYQARLVVVVFLFTLVVMTSLATTVGMLYVIRGALMETSARRNASEAKEGLFGALNRTALVFSGIYMTWSFINQDISDFMNIDLFRQPDRVLVDAFAGQDSGVMAGLINLDFKVSLATAAVAYLVKTFFGRRHEAGQGRFSGIMATFGELAFVFYGLNAIWTLAGARSAWIGDRAVVASGEKLAADAQGAIPGWEWFWSDVWPHALDGLAVPLAWLTVGILVYGAYAEDTQTTIRGTPLETAAARLQDTHSLTRRALSKLTSGWTERWIPLLNSLRLTVRGGAPLFGLFALCYVGLHIGGDYLGRAGQYLLASDKPYFYFVTDVPVFFVAELLVTTLTMCLIAATFDLAATRDRLRRRSVTG
ncbi:hypothetical protein Psi02_72900 [Planotetraspora silvatica]|uniref:Uncharacterized protein n=2 Tax=Planotetraspora silvatica TaxID=234614 RepID=A0A8J3UWQ3_9ACTN|nr:hypothetical protein Psi02_72900 [Planotetraspora silvatica]